MAAAASLLAAALLLALAPRHAAASRAASVDWGTEASAAKQFSLQRSECLAREDLSSRIYPPEEYPGDKYILRKAVPATPIGDVHLMIEDLQLTRVSLAVTLNRTSDEIISFSLLGTGGEPMGSVEAWVVGLSFDAPQSTLDELIIALSKTENWFGQVGLGKNYGQLRNLKVSVNISMSGDLRADASGNWKLVEGSQKSQAKFDIGSGGMLLKIVNRFLQSGGQASKDIEQVVLDTVGPTLAALLPEFTDRLLREVPLADGQAALTVDLQVLCRDPQQSSPTSKSKRRCPDHLMDVSATVQNRVRFQPRKVVKELSELKPATGGALSGLMEAYHNATSQVANGLVGNFTVGLELAENQALQLHTRPSLEVPLSLLAALAPGAARMEDFLPEVGNLTVKAGGLNASEGVIRMPQVYMDKVHLPVGTGQDTIELRGKLEDFTVEVEDGTGVASASDPGFIGRDAEPDPVDLLCKLVGKNSPLTVSAPGVTLSANREGGAYLEPSGGGYAFAAKYDWEGLVKLLKELDDQMPRPVSVRNHSASPDDFDSAVPMEFQRPHDHELQKWDLKSLLRGLAVSVGGGVAATREGEELVEVGLSANVTGELWLGEPVWRAILDGKDKDLGYLNLMVAGWYGELPGKKRLALARLSCGSLEMYKLDGSGRSVAPDKPFEGKPHITLDLADDKAWKPILEEGKPELINDLLCFKVKIWSGNWLFTARKKYFCPATADDGRKLQEALRMQRRRLEGALAESEAHPCKGAAPQDCPAQPDGTWFKPFRPYDVATWPPEFAAPGDPSMHKSPREQWKSAVAAVPAAPTAALA